jgi:hypothetical protein
MLKHVQNKVDAKNGHEIPNGTLKNSKSWKCVG